MDDPSQKTNRPFYGLPVPDFVDENGQFVDADFRCDRCGVKVNVQFHPAMLSDMPKVYRWLDENAPCACKWDKPD